MSKESERDELLCYVREGKLKVDTDTLAKALKSGNHVNLNTFIIGGLCVIVWFYAQRIQTTQDTQVLLVQNAQDRLAQHDKDISTLQGDVKQVWKRIGAEVLASKPAHGATVLQNQN